MILFYIPDVVLSAGEGMRRREFLTLLGGVVAIRPRIARAQRSSPPPVVGVLDDSGARWVAAFRQGLREGGLAEGRDVVMDLQSSEQCSELRPLADQLVQRRVAVIAALDGVPAKVAKARRSPSCSQSAVIR